MRKKGNTKKKIEKSVIQRQLDIMNQWFILKQNNISIETILCNRGWEKVAIYGMGLYGRHLVRELKNAEHIQLVYGIDMQVLNSYLNIEIVKIENAKVSVDGVINTIFYDNTVEKEIRNKLHCDVISFEDLIFESYVMGESNADSRI